MATNELTELQQLEARHSAEWMVGFRYGFYRGFAKSMTRAGTANVDAKDAHITDVLWKWLQHPETYNMAVTPLFDEPSGVEDPGAGPPGRIPMDRGA